jgi:hypothetical protein
MKKLLTQMSKSSMLLHTYIHTYIHTYKQGLRQKLSNYGRRCSYLVAAPLYYWKGARHSYYSCSYPLNRGGSL